MRLSENRPVAWAVLALAVLLSISLSGGGAMRNMRGETERIFYEGAMQNGVRTGLSISRDLNVRAEKAAIIASIGKQYLSASDQRILDVEAACRELAGAKQPQAYYQANVGLARAMEDLYSALEHQSLSGSDSDAVYAAYKEMQSRADTISRDLYNTEAHKFNASISRFPANLISGFVNVTPLQTFD